MKLFDAEREFVNIDRHAYFLSEVLMKHFQGGEKVTLTIHYTE